MGEAVDYEQLGIPNSRLESQAFGIWNHSVHSHATQLLRAGIHPKIAQERLGHSTIATTLDLYSHVTDTMQDDAARRVDSAIRAAINERTKGEH